MSISYSKLDIEEGDYAAEATRQLHRAIKDRLEELEGDDRSITDAETDESSLHFNVPTEDAGIWLEALEEILLTDEVQAATQQIVEAAMTSKVPFQLAGLDGRIRIGPEVTDDGEPIKGRTVIYAEVNPQVYGREINDRRAQLHAAIGAEVLRMNGATQGPPQQGKRTYTGSNYSSSSIGFGIPSEDIGHWADSFQEAFTSDEIQKLAQEVFSMATSLKATQKPGRGKR